MDEILMKSKLDLNSKQLSSIEKLIDNIANGSIVINSVEAMRDIIKKVPNEPCLERMYADMLLEHKMLEGAAKAYNRSARLYYKKGKMLSAIVAKISHWHTEMPSDHNVKTFFSALKGCKDNDLPINNFFSKLSTNELKSFCFLFETVLLPANQTIKKVGDIEDHLFFIVSGKLEDSLYMTLQNQGRIFRKPTLILSENDYFGKVYPFNEEHRSQSYIKTLEPTELVSISKEKLLQICRKYPNIELAIIDLLKIRSQSVSSESSVKIRRHPRYKFRLRLTLEIFPKKSNEKIISLEGYSKDISVGGMGIILDLKQLNDKVDSSSFSSFLNNAKIRVNMTMEACSILVSGRIAWSREIVHEGAKTIAIGMQFSDMSPGTQGFLFALINSLYNG